MRGLLKYALAATIFCTGVFVSFVAIYRNVPYVRLLSKEEINIRPVVVCGKNFQTIKEKIANCTSHNSDLASISIGAFENNWSLVSLYSDSLNNGETCIGDSCSEVWRDNATGLIWSDDFGGNYDYCEAMGVKHLPSVAKLFNSGCQNKRMISACSKKAGFETPTTTYFSKGNIVNASWRVPTKDDWILAINHGANKLFRVHWAWTASLSYMGDPLVYSAGNFYAGDLPGGDYYIYTVCITDYRDFE